MGFCSTLTFRAGRLALQSLCISEAGTKPELTRVHHGSIASEREDKQIADEKTTRGRNQDRDRVAGGQGYEVVAAIVMPLRSDLPEQLVEQVAEPRLKDIDLSFGHRHVLSPVVRHRPCYRRAPGASSIGADRRRPTLSLRTASAIIAHSGKSGSSLWGDFNSCCLPCLLSA
jgi:hypothetical protein